MHFESFPSRIFAAELVLVVNLHRCCLYPVAAIVVEGFSTEKGLICDCGLSFDRAAKHDGNLIVGMENVECLDERMAT